MKKRIKFSILFLLFSILSHSQIKFEAAYFIDENDSKVECFIKNIDWKYNPTGFTYKLSEDGEVKEADIKSVKEFGIYNNSKYVRAKVNIDRSRSETEYLTFSRAPSFKLEELFLKVLVEGENTLYYFEDDFNKRFFYKNKNATEIEQLIYKEYKISRRDGDFVAENNFYKQQLFTTLDCESKNDIKFDRLSYKRKSLITLFEKCNNNGPSVVYTKIVDDKKAAFNYSIKSHFNYYSLAMYNIAYNSWDIEFNKGYGYGLGMEIEYMLPFNNNKWSLIAEPNFQKKINSTTVDKKPELAGVGEIEAILDYAYISLPLGIRYNTYLNNGSRFFLNFYTSLEFDMNSQMIYHMENREDKIFDIKALFKPEIGLGFRSSEKMSFEIRYIPKTNITKGYLDWISQYSSVSLLLGYDLF